MLVPLHGVHLQHKGTTKHHRGPSIGYTKSTTMTTQ